MYSHCTGTVRALYRCCAGNTGTAANVQSLRHHCTVTMQSLRHHCAVTMQPLHRHCAVTMQPLRHHHPFTVQSLCSTGTACTATVTVYEVNPHVAGRQRDIEHCTTLGSAVVAAVAREHLWAAFTLSQHVSSANPKTKNTCLRGPEE